MLHLFFQSVKNSYRKILTAVSIVLLLALINPLNAQYNFNLSELQGANNLGGNPTTLQFGPDGRLYVGVDLKSKKKECIMKDSHG